MGVEVQLLGGVRATLDGVPVQLGGRRPSMVLASLALADRRVLSADRLIDLVWADNLPTTARRTLQSYVSGLRRVLGGEDSPLSASGAGYVLAIERTGVDVFVLADAVTRAKAEIDADPLAAAARLSAVLESWAVPLDGLRPTLALEAVVAPYEELRLEALEVLNDVELDNGDVGRAVGRLETLVREHPVRERFWAQLIRGLAALGRRDAALQAGQRARESLREHLGVVPSQLLQRVEQELLDDGPIVQSGEGPPRAAALVPPERMDQTTAGPTAAASAVSVRALLFTDIEGSTGLLRRLGARYEHLLDRHQAIIRESSTTRSGVEQSREGDGLFITFPSVTAALEAALDAQRRLEREPWPPDGRVRVRMGLHVGEVAESRAGLVGVAIHQAARIASAAHGGQLVVSGDVVRHAGSLPTDAAMRLLGDYELRDIGRVTLYQVQHPDLQDEFAGLRTNRAAAHNLPAPLTSLVGRDIETGLVSALLDEHRLVTLVGEGGCGKTRLALSVGATGLSRFVDGVWFVDLSPLPPGADVTSRVGQALGTHSGGLDDLLAALGQRAVLLIVDNCEHVLESTAALVAAVLSECPTTSVLATSRSPLEVGGEMCYPVPPLEVPRRGADLSEAQTAAAVELFTTRAALVRPGYRLVERDVEAVVELSIRLEGLPLAIELAAAQLRTMSPSELVERIDDRFGLLIGGPRSAPERHRALRDTIEWSARLLDAAEQHVLRHLAVFRDGCDFESAEAVCGTDMPSEARPFDVVRQLVDKSLVTPVEVDGATRYRLHETIREYVVGSTSASDLALIQERHARWFARVASRLSVGPAPGGERSWIQRHSDECDNFRAAAEWLLVRDAPAALRLLLDIEPGIDMTLQSTWSMDLLRHVLPLTGGSPAGDRAAAVALLAWNDSEEGLPSALEELRQAVELLADADDPVVDCYVLSAVAKCHADVAGGELDTDEVAAAVSAADRVGGTYWPIMIRTFLSWKAPPAVGQSLLTDALMLAERMRLDHFATMLRCDLACIAQFRGDSSQALETWRQIAPMLDDLGLYQSESACFYALAEGEHGEVAVGLHLAEHLVLRLTRRPHDPVLAAAMHSVIAHLRRLAGDPAGSQAALDAASRAGPPTRNFVGGLAIITRSALWRQRGQPRRAAAVIEQAHHHLGFRGSTDISKRVLEELAAVSISLGRYQDGADLLATARAARQREHMPLSPACQVEIDELSTQVGALRGVALTTTEATELAHSLAGSKP